MLRQDLSARMVELRASRVPFVHARVIVAERPTSAKPGDEAIVMADGTMEGFVGGACAEATVREQALGVLGSGDPLLVRITPEAGEEPPAVPGANGRNRLVVHNPCLSGGSLEVFLEPDLPAPLVVVVGHAPMAEAVVAVGQALGYQLMAYEGRLPPDTAAVVVASHGRGEEHVLAAALAAGVPYVGLVASARRGRAVVDSLEGPEEQRSRVHTPAGLDIGARTPGEVAVSILAEIVATRPRPEPPVPLRRPAGAGVDPVCGMSVPAGADALHLEIGDRLVWFCGSGCRQAFLAEPDRYPG